MKFLKSHFALSRSQQNGIFVLIVLIILFQIVIFGMDYLPSNEEPIDQERLEAFTRQMDSIEKARPGKKDTIYPFNPNFLSDFKGYQLGMKAEEIDRLLRYRENGQWINSSEDFQEVTKISDDLLRKISPSFRFPAWIQKNSSKSNFEHAVQQKLEVSDLNLATAEDLQAINGIGAKLSERIIKYRFKIGGFLDSSQLNDVYGLSPEVIEKLNARFKIITRPKISIISIHTATAAELAEIPYLSPEMARKIINYRNLHERISSFEELSKIDAFPSDKIDRIKLYLAVE